MIDDASYPTSAKSASLLYMDRVLGFSLDRVIAKPLEIPFELRQLIAEREVARNARDWVAADALRKEIEARGWTLEDTPNGTKVRLIG